MSRLEMGSRIHYEFRVVTLTERERQALINLIRKTRAEKAENIRMPDALASVLQKIL